MLLMENTILKKYTDQTQEETVIIPEGVTEIASLAFSRRSKVKSIIIPSTVQKIAYHAFQGTGIESIIIPDTVTEIGEGLFEDCRRLTSAVIGKNITKIPHGTFRYCQLLEHLELPEGLEYVGDNAFEECYTLKTAWVGGKEYHISGSEVPKAVELVFNSLEKTRQRLWDYYESGLMDEFEYVDFQIAGDGYSY